MAHLTRPVVGGSVSDMDSPDLDRRERNKRRTRAAIRDAAVDLFARKGFVETTITDAADVSRRTFFRYFSTKEDILGDDLRMLLPRVRAALEQRPADEHPLDAILEAVVTVIPARGIPRFVFRIGRRADLMPFGRRLLPFLLEWERGIADSLLIRWGSTPADAPEALRLRALVTACAATSALRCASMHGALTHAGELTITEELVAPVRVAMAILVEGCPAPVTGADLTDAVEIGSSRSQG